MKTIDLHESQSGWNLTVNDSNGPQVTISVTRDIEEDEYFDDEYEHLENDTEAEVPFIIEVLEAARHM